MRGHKLSLLPAWLGIVAAMALVAGAARVHADEMKLEAQLIWGTNDGKPHDPKLKPVSPELAKKLKDSPFKWENYYLINTKDFSVGENAEKTVTMSRECDITVKNLGNSQVQLQLVGKGITVGKITQSLPKGQLLVTGGNAANKTAWFVVLRQAD